MILGRNSFNTGISAAMRAGFVGDGIDHGALLAERQSAAQRFRIGAIQAERHGNRFLHDVHQPRQDFQLLSRQAAIHVEHVRARLHLPAGQFP